MSKRDNYCLNLKQSRAKQRIKFMMCSSGSAPASTTKSVAVGDRATSGQVESSPQERHRSVDRHHENEPTGCTSEIINSVLCFE